MAEAIRKIPIPNPKEYEAVIGDTIELQFNVFSFPIIEKWHKEFITRKLKADPHIEVLNIETGLPGTLIVVIQVINNPLPLILVIGSVTSVLAGWFVWASIGSVYKIIKDPAIRQTVNVGLLVAGGVVGLLLMRAIK